MFKALAILPLLAALTTPAARAGTTTINTALKYQTIEGFGGATAFYAGWITAHPFKQEIYTNAFAGLNLSMLRLGDWYRYQTPLAGFDAAATEIVSNANRVLGSPVPVYMSSWSPPAFLKSNGQTGNGGTLVMTNGGFAYTNFAQYWYDSLQAYQSNGVTMKWISIQNEPDWVAGYDSCILNPAEGVVNGTNYASYTKAMDATYQKLTNLPAPPKLLAPEPTHIAYTDLQNYSAYMDTNSFYGVAYHLYGDSANGMADGNDGDLSAAANIFPGKPHFMTEYGYPDLLQTACMIHDCLTVGQDSGVNYWSLVWPVGGDGLIIQENPYDLSSWTNAPPGVTTQSHGWWYAPAYWAMKHFSYFITPGFTRISATDTDNNIRSSAYLSPNGLRLVVVLINTNTTASAAMNFSLGTFSVGTSSVYQTAGTNTYAGTNTFLALGAWTNGQVLPPLSVTTVVLNGSLSNILAGPAGNPAPANNLTGVPVNAGLRWTPGSNALAHAVYLGLNSNTVAQATTTAPVFQGLLTATNFSPLLAAGSTYFWRVDEVAGNTNTGPVWSFTTTFAPAALAHRYTLNEAGGTNVTDSVGGATWNGTLPRGGTFGGGNLTFSAASEQYLNLPGGILSTNAAATIEMWVPSISGATASPPYVYLFAFGDTDGSGAGYDYIFFNPNLARVAISAVDPGYDGEQGGDLATSLGLASNLHLTCVFDCPNGTIRVYTNGVLASAFTGITDSLSTVGSQYAYIGRSLYTADAYLTWTLEELRIYRGAMSTNQIAATQALGPNQPLTLSSPPLSAVPAGGNLTLSWPLSAAGFGLMTRTNLILGNWVHVTSPGPQIISNQWRITLPSSATPQFFRLQE